MLAINWLVNAILNLAWWLIIASAVFSWLVAFNVVNMSNPFIRQIGEFLWQITEPMIRPVRRIMPNLGAIDISPIIVLLAISFLQIFWNTSIFPPLYRAVSG